MPSSHDARTPCTRSASDLVERRRRREPRVQRGDVLGRHALRREREQARAARAAAPERTHAPHVVGADALVAQRDQLVDAGMRILRLVDRVEQIAVAVAEWRKRDDRRGGMRRLARFGGDLDDGSHGARRDERDRVGGRGDGCAR